MLLWQEESFDPERIDEELGWAEDIGMNTMRVYLHDLLHKSDKEGLYKRMNEFLKIADSHGIKPLFVLFDSCWDPFPKAGEQRAPKPHVHNSGWVQSPGQEVLKDSTQYGRLKLYVKETIGAFRTDDRILGWDIWNEPDNMTGPSYEDIEIPNKGEVSKIAGIKPISALIKAVKINEIKISLFLIGAINKFVKFLLHISSKNNILKPILVLNKKS